jgi:SAM-dependent methyltransferase
MSDSCPLCRSADTVEFFEVKGMPQFIGVQWDSAEEARASARGDIRLIGCRNCSFIWNRSFAPDQLSYSPRYDNTLDLSPAFQSFARSVAMRLINDYEVREKHILELGCGKGHFLKLLCEAGANRGTGFDPSCEVAPASPSPTAPVFIQDFFGNQYRSYAGDLVCCRHVLEHIAEPLPFLSMVGEAGVRTGGVAYFEVPNARFVFDQPSVWDVIYEHCNYFSAASLAFAFRSCGFEVIRMDEPFRGQYLSIDARLAPNGAKPGEQPSDTVANDARVKNFATKAASELEKWTSQLRRFEVSGERVVIWGAGAKTVSFVNMVPGPTSVRHAVDINPRKQGKYLSGGGQQILPPEFLRDFQPTKVLLMNPVYRQEVQDQLLRLGVSAEILEV